MAKYFFISFFITSSIIFSQENSNFNPSEYYETNNDRLNVKFEIDNDIESFEYDNGISSYNIVPNSSLRTSVSAHTRFLTLRIGYAPNFLASNDADDKGNTKVFKTNLDIFMKRWMQTIELSSVKGYYIDQIEGPGNILPPDDSKYFLLPELKALRIRGVTSYKFNDHLSFKALYRQTDIQKISTGSFIPSLTYQYLKLEDKDSPESTKSFDIIINTGYYYTFVINNKWYTNLGLSPGLGYEFNKVTTGIPEGKAISKSNEVIFNINTLMGIGYNSKHFFSGINLRGIATTRDEQSLVQFNTVRGIFQLFVGYRFNTPKFVDRSFDWIEDQNPLK
ncbi:MAG: DUF4421 domain-containing protein [Flavobacteriaceae bacterium]|nr:DUF4421 domain-containing protein [Flavobacteriaceae bacterium]